MIAPGFHLAPDDVGVSICEYLIFAPPGSVAHMGHIGMVAGTGKDLVQIRHIKPIYAAGPFYHIDPTIPHSCYAGSLTPPML